MEKRERVFSGAIWEEQVGYCRAVRVGSTIEVAGTTATNSKGEIIGTGDAYVQTCYIFKKIEQTLQQFGAGLENVIRTRMYVTNIDNWEAVGKAHGEFFKQIRPVATMVEVSRLIHPDLLVEIEVSALL